MEKIVGNYKIKILHDPGIMNPRSEFDCNLGTMVCFHKRYNLGDKHSWNYNAYNNWDDFHKALNKTFKIAVILPLYLYDHSGITMNTTGFSCQWDSGQVGFIYVTKEIVRGDFKVKRISKKLKEKVKTILLAEVEVYDVYLRNDGFKYEIWKLDKNGNEIELVEWCEGYYKYEDCLSDAESDVPPQPIETQLEIPFEN